MPKKTPCNPIVQAGENLFLNVLNTTPLNRNSSAIGAIIPIVIIETTE